MGTVVTIEVVNDDSEASQAIDRAFAWFELVETTCSRFDPTSELRELSNHIGQPVVVSDLLFRAVEFALAVADDTSGAFDPTVGVTMEARGFNRDYRTGTAAPTGLAAQATGPVSYRDIAVNAKAKTIALGRPLLLDLGAVAKGLAVDLAAHELATCRDFAVNAGGDLFVSGHNAEGDAWNVGIRHPREDHVLLGSLRLSNAAVCTSGDYERPTSDGRDHHIVDTAGHAGSPAVASATVVAPTAMLADALATAIFVSGPEAGLALARRHGVAALIVTPELEEFATPDFWNAALLPHA